MKKKVLYPVVTILLGANYLKAQLKLDSCGLQDYIKLKISTPGL